MNGKTVQCSDLMPHTPERHPDRERMCVSVNLSLKMDTATGSSQLNVCGEFPPTDRMLTSL